jgi:hypothetical protein
VVGATNTAALAFGGIGPPGGNEDATETWNGTNWTEVNDMNTEGRKVAGTRSNNTAALAVGGWWKFSKYRNMEWNKLDRSK